MIIQIKYPLRTIDREKQKRWQFYLIVAVMALTLYNILPTVFYYTKPLGSPIVEGRAKEVAVGTMDRVMPQGMP